MYKNRDLDNERRQGLLNPEEYFLDWLLVLEKEGKIENKDIENYIKSFTYLWLKIFKTYAPRDYEKMLKVYLAECKKGMTGFIDEILNLYWLMDCFIIQSIQMKFSLSNEKVKVYNSLVEALIERESGRRKKEEIEQDLEDSFLKIWLQKDENVPINVKILLQVYDSEKKDDLVGFINEMISIYPNRFKIPKDVEY